MSESRESTMPEETLSSEGHARIRDTVGHRRLNHGEDVVIDLEQRNTEPTSVTSNTSNARSPVASGAQEWLMRVLSVCQAAGNDKISIHAFVECDDVDEDRLPRVKYLCNYCKSCFGSEEELLCHMEKHVFVCPFCDYRSFQRHRIVRHSLISHVPTDWDINMCILKYDGDTLRRNTGNADMINLEDVVKFKPLSLKSLDPMEVALQCREDKTVNETSGYESRLSSSRSYHSSADEHSALEFPPSQNHMPDTDSSDSFEDVVINPGVQNSPRLSSTLETTVHSNPLLPAATNHLEEEGAVLLDIGESVPSGGAQRDLQGCARGADNMLTSSVNHKSSDSAPTPETSVTNGRQHSYNETSDEAFTDVTANKKCRKRKELTDHIHNEVTEKHRQQNEARQAPKRKSSQPRKQNCSVQSISHSRRSGSRQDTTEQEAGVNLMLGNIWMGKTKTDHGLEIIIPSADDIENVYRPDIAQLWKIADELMETDDKMRFKCRVCQFFSSNQGHVREHIGALHLALPEWMCRYCPYKNSRRPAVVDHLKSEHKRDKLCVVRCRPYQRNEEVENIVSTTTIKAFCRLTKEGIKYLAQSVLNLDLRCSLDASGNHPIFECSRCQHSSPSYDDLHHHLGVHDRQPLPTVAHGQSTPSRRSRRTCDTPYSSEECQSADSTEFVNLLSPPRSLSDSDSDGDNVGSDDVFGSSDEGCFD